MEIDEIMDTQGIAASNKKVALPLYIGQTYNPIQRIGLQHCREGQRSNMFMNIAESKNYFQPPRITFPPSKLLKGKFRSIEEHWEGKDEEYRWSILYPPTQIDSIIKQTLKNFLSDLKKNKNLSDAESLINENKGLNKYSNLLNALKKSMNKLKEFIEKVEKKKYSSAALNDLINGKTLKTAIYEQIADVFTIARDGKEKICAKPVYIPMRRLNYLKLGFWTFIDLKTLIDNTPRFKKKIDQGQLGYKHFLDNFESFTIDTINKHRFEIGKQKLVNKDDLIWTFPDWLDVGELEFTKKTYLSWIWPLLTGDHVTCDEIMNIKIDDDFCLSKSWIYAYWRGFL